MLNITNHQRSANQNQNDLSPHLLQQPLSKEKKAESDKHWKMWKREIIIHC